MQEHVPASLHGQHVQSAASSHSSSPCPSVHQANMPADPRPCPATSLHTPPIPHALACTQHLAIKATSREEERVGSGWTRRNEKETKRKERRASCFVFFSYRLREEKELMFLKGFYIFLERESFGREPREKRSEGHRLRHPESVILFTSTPMCVLSCY